MICEISDRGKQWQNLVRVEEESEEMLSTEDKKTYLFKHQRQRA